ncbi:hypothetical protein COU78_03425 [Candidatus Peregrinibacteria bacterium CG10_big_fil_rev_8_21_14_0_10_49_24]|nr:MAG: hypothetical protein COV83_05245 [Candidatus Peregrinibacteria bacterium CG11_big_fil_rev_8_21_14_0_20_49_14]PIR51171.1 MAG: hypothetical protein COU78_03425 [Candidatus Peregrinibacteria bacterium CG10_big_fil_rev_8_21_14_0_10_49_24]PJA67210.1 MAG: hypothetical protein CO157_05580 [Candidatus Peregrinibacteria bacterium CG_4_9_14_3_um_filter_49_12]
MVLTANDILIGLEIAVAIMIIIVLYHALFIAVDLRKVLRRVEEITSQLEEAFLKPISLVEHVMEYAIDLFEEKHADGSKKEKKKEKKSSSKKK